MTTQSVLPRPAAPEVAAPAEAPGAYRLAGAFALATGVALLLAVLAGPVLAVVGLVLFGVLHNWYELRYLLGTYRDVLVTRALPLLLALITGIVLCRLAVPGDVGRRTEVLLASTVLAVAALAALRGAALWLRAGVVVLLCGATAASLARPDLHFVLLAHLHNVLPAVFVWHWAAHLPQGPRRLLRGTQVVWTAVVPVLLVAGAADRWTPPLGDLPWGASLSALLQTVTPPAWTGDVLALRLLVVFAFMQTVHYLVWCWFLPRHDRGAAARFEQEPLGQLLRGRRFAAAAGGCALLLAAVFWSDYQSGRALYLSFTSFHAYLELAVLVALLSCRVPRGRP